LVRKMKKELKLKYREHMTKGMLSVVEDFENVFDEEIEKSISIISKCVKAVDDKNVPENNENGVFINIGAIQEVANIGECYRLRLFLFRNFMDSKEQIKLEELYMKKVGKDIYSRI